MFCSTAKPLKGIMLLSTCCLTFLVVFFFSGSYGQTAPGDSPKKILLIFSYDFDYPGIAQMRKGFSAVFAQHTHLGLPYSLEEFQLAAPEDEDYFKNIVSDLNTKYANDKPDLVIAGYKQATEFMARHGKEIFEHIPVVFAGLDIEDYNSIKLPANFYGAISSFSIHKNLELILKNHPAAKTVYVIAGASAAEREMTATVMSIGEIYKDRVGIVVLEQKPYYHMLALLNEIPANSVILYLSMRLDINGRFLAPTVVASDIARAAKVPVYGIMDSYSGSGITGGFLVDHEYLGRRVADISLSILNDTSQFGLQIVNEPAGAYTFDWRELNRWKIEAGSLPPESQIEFREFSVWRAYKWQILGGIGLVFLQGCLILGLLINRSKRRQAQEQLLEERESRARSEKMASIGMLAAGIAHEINQPLNAIKVISSGMLFAYRQGRERDKAELMQNLEEVSRQASRAADIVLHLRSLIQQGDKKFKLCDINVTVSRVLELIGQQLQAHKISVELELERGLPALLGNPTALEELIINLLINSTQALDTLDKGEKLVKIKTRYNDGIVLEVSDNGPGINPRLGTKIFEPFVSTKTNADSLGLGLAIVSNIVTSHRGTVRYDTGQETGASFIVKFPKTDNVEEGLAK